MGLGGYPATDRQFVGMLGMHGTYEANMAMQHCDVLLAVGARFDDRVIGNPMEPRACLASFDAASGVYHVHVPSQGVIPMRRQLAGLVGVEEHQVRVEVNDVGGSFGMKNEHYPEYPLCLWAAQRIGRPVKWVSDRSEAMASDDHDRDHVCEAALALDRGPCLAHGHGRRAVGVVRDRVGGEVDRVDHEAGLGDAGLEISAGKMSALPGAPEPT